MTNDIKPKAVVTVLTPRSTKITLNEAIETLESCGLREDVLEYGKQLLKDHERREKRAAFLLKIKLFFKRLFKRKES
jgi:hypothetical protein